MPTTQREKMMLRRAFWQGFRFALAAWLGMLTGAILFGELMLYLHGKRSLLMFVLGWN